MHGVLRGRKALIHIDNLKEKELLIAHYFSENTKKELTPHEVFDMWANWFKNDFRINNQPVFYVVDNELVYRKSVRKKDEKIRDKYNHAFQNIYKWIYNKVVTKSHDKMFFKQELQKERNREYGRVISFAKPLGIYITMNKSYSGLAEFKLMEYGNRSHTITSGDCDKMIAYLQNLKKEKMQECNSNN